MPKRTRLLASVAMPLISISLLVPSVHAAMPGVQPPMRGVQSDIIHVQAPAPAAEAAPAEEELKKRRPPPEAQGEGRPERPAGEPQERPRAEPPSEQPRPKRAEPQAEAPARAAPEPKAEQQRPEPPREPKAEQAKPEAPREPKPEPKSEPKPELQREPQKEPKAVEPKPVEPKPAEPKPAERPAPPAEPAQQRAAPPAEAAPPQPGAERPAGQRPEGEPSRPERPRNEQRPAARPGEAPQVEPGRPAAPERPAAPPAPPAAAQPGTPPVPPAAPPAPPAPPAAPPAPPAPAQRSDATPPAPPQGQPPVAVTPKTPQDIERAKAIANNPAQAQGTVVLPVENGAAVLDSAKEAPAAAVAPAPAQPGAAPAPGQRRDGPRPGAAAPGAPAAVPGQAQAPAPIPAPAPTAPPPPPPTSDAAAQAAAPGAQPVAPVRIESFSRIQGERLRERPRFEDPRGWDDVRRADDGRVIIQFDNRTFVRHDDSERFISDGYRPEYDRLPGGRTRETYERDGGVQIVTIRNRYGDVVQRSRIGRDGREIILFYAPELADDRADRDYRWRDPGAELPPMRLTIPVNQYIIDTTSDPDRDYYRFLEQPPVERVERVYSVDEVRYSARIRDKVRRIDLDTITFATGSADIPMNQASSLRKVADAIKKVLERDPSETFLIEGHTDAVGSDESNLVLSDRRAESVARVLTDAFGIPPENMVTQGYGERYLKVATQGPEQQNRRVTIRRITALVKPVAQNR